MALISDCLLRSCTRFVCLQKTRAYHRLQDDVPADVKQRRLQELIAVFREEAARANEAMVGQSQLVLVEGVSMPEAIVVQETRLQTTVITSAFTSHLSPHNPETPRPRAHTAHTQVVSLVFQSTDLSKKWC